MASRQQSVESSIPSDRRKTVLQNVSQTLQAGLRCTNQQDETTRIRILYRRGTLLKPVWTYWPSDTIDSGKGVNYPLL